MEKDVNVVPTISQRFVTVETEYPEEGIVTEDSYRIQLKKCSEIILY